MKRLVICCDGTWNRPDSRYITNIEKIARTVHTGLSRTGGVQQQVLYLTGVGGAGYRVDQVLGGAFGLGLFQNVLAGYRFLALNYEPDDEIFVLGFSRGAYTARSLVGMLDRVGLLTRRAMVAEKLPEAVARYQRRQSSSPESDRSAAEFKRDYCHPDTPVRFLGVFDTVGALGVPGALRRRHRFHDVQLSDLVLCARQALAVDEPRMTFEPSLWKATPGREPALADRVRQVWFEGVHADVGGGYAETGLSDTALLWMVTEARAQGLVLDESLLRSYTRSGSPAIRHDPMTIGYRLLNVVTRLEIALRLRGGRAYLGSRRRLDRSDCLSVRIASATVEHFRADPEYRPANLRSYSQSTSGFTGCLETVVALPKAASD